jgi:hypothetical protein
MYFCGITVQSEIAPTACKIEHSGSVRLPVLYSPSRRRLSYKDSSKVTPQPTKPYAIPGEKVLGEESDDN